MTLKTKTALVTGSTSGIGLAIARALAAEGANIVLNGFGDAQAVEEARAGIESTYGVKARYSAADMSKPDAIAAMVREAEETFGAVDVLVNNGAFQQPNEDLAGIDDAVFEDHFRTNVFGAFYVTKAALAHLKPGASVIFTSSVNSKHPMPSLLAYSATKGALSNMVLSLSQLLADKGVRVNGVLPGPIWIRSSPPG